MAEPRRERRWTREGWEPWKRLSGNERGVLVAAAFAVAGVWTFAVLDEEEPRTLPAAPRQPPPVRRPMPPAQPALLSVEQPQKLAARLGETVRFRVRSRADDVVQVHGYEIERAIPADRPVLVSFVATIPGTFLIELKQSGEDLGQLVVEEREPPGAAPEGRGAGG